jgi:hypothetical protein
MSAPRTSDPPSLPTGLPTLSITKGEFLWLNLAVWLGGIFILTLMPYLLIPRVGGPLAIAGSYFLFFLAWQPIQIITQRTLGLKSAIVRMILFVASAATIASYLRQALPTLTGAA